MPETICFTLFIWISAIIQNILPVEFSLLVTILWVMLFAFTGYNICREISSSPAKKSINRPIRENICYRLAFAPVYVLSLLSRKTSKRYFGRAIYFLVFRVFRYRHEVVLQNLSRALPYRNYPQIKQLAKNYYKHLAALIIENLQLFSKSPEQQLKEVQLANPELLDTFYRQKRPVIVLMGHYGNWECLNILPLCTPFTVNAIYKPLSSQLMDSIVHKLRTRFGMHLIPAPQSLRYLLKHKDKPCLTLFIADQYPGENAHCSTDFLNQPTPMFMGAEKVAKRIDAAVIYLEMVKKREMWEVRTSLIAANANDAPEGDITCKFAGKLQQTIEKSPPYWLWSHRRWK